MRSARLLNDETARTAPEHIAHRNVGVQNFTGAWIAVIRATCKTHIGTDEPANGGVTRIQVVPISILRLLPGLHRVLEANLFERLVPLQDASGDGSPVLQRNVLVEPIHDGLFGLGHRGCWVFLLQTPAVHVMQARVRFKVVGQVRDKVKKVAQARVGFAWRHGHFGKLAEAVDKAHKEAAWVGHGAGRWRHGHRAWHQGRRRNARGGKVKACVQRRQILGDPGFLEVGIASVKAVGHPKRLL